MILIAIKKNLTYRVCRSNDIPSFYFKIGVSSEILRQANEFEAEECNNNTQHYSRGDTIV